MVPVAALPPFVPFTAQVTAFVGSPVTATLNWTVPPTLTVHMLGPRLTMMDEEGNGGFVFDGPPPQETRWKTAGIKAPKIAFRNRITLNLPKQSPVKGRPDLLLPSRT